MDSNENPSTYAFKYVDELLVILSRAESSLAVLQRRFSGTNSEEEEEDGEGAAFETQKVEFANIQDTQDVLYRLCYNLVRLRRQFLEQGSRLDADPKRKELVRFRYEWE